MDTGIIVGLVIGLLFLLVISGVLVWCCCCRKKRRPDRALDELDALSVFPDTIDLHGYYVADAKDKMIRFLQEATRRGMSPVYVITGRGLHSADGIPAIKNMVQQFLSNNRYRHKWQNKGGKVCIYLK